MADAITIITLAIVLCGASVVFVWSIMAAYGFTTAIVQLHNRKIIKPEPKIAEPELPQGYDYTEDVIKRIDAELRREYKRARS